MKSMVLSFAFLVLIAFAPALVLAEPGPGNCPAVATCTSTEDFKSGTIDCVKCTVTGDDNQSYTGQACGGTPASRLEGARKNAVKACNTPKPKPKNCVPGTSQESNGKSGCNTQGGFTFDGIEYK